MQSEDATSTGSEERDHAGESKGPKRFHYFVDGQKYDSDSASLTGAQIKAQIPNFDPAYQLVLEGRGNDPDAVIGDNDTTSLQPPPHFYTAPPANFG